MNEKQIIRGKLNKRSIKIDQTLNEIEDSNVLFSSNIFIQCKNSQEQISESSNILFPRVNSDYNNICDPFITDIVKKAPDNNENEELLPNVLKSLYFNQLPQKDQEQEIKKYDSKGTNRPSFSSDDGTPKVVTKYKSIPWGFETSIAFPINESDHYMKYIKDQFAQVKEKNMSLIRHNSLNPSNFINCFNNCMHNKLQVTPDIKNIIYNSSKSDYETRVKLIKNLIKTEMQNRSTGRGVFKTNYKVRTKNINKWKEQATQRRMEIEHNPIIINLKKKEFFDQKVLDKSVDICFNRNFLRYDYDVYKADKEKKQIERNKNKEYHTNIAQLYHKGKIKINFDSHRDRKVLNAIKAAKLDNDINEQE